MTTVDQNLVRQTWDLPADATLTVTWEAGRPATEAELLLLARLAALVERSTVLKGGDHST